MSKAPAPLRCAIYTRVSTEYGLDQEFNSLVAQREACEAYITSQKHEGWTLVPTQSNDGRFSGGSLNRPALQQLLSAIAAGEVDVVVVYKVDRLTRSLADFAKLVELFDAQGVSFVSVTQSFNTTSSMGRLTLNVLLSFAQFEREVTGERIRDKIAASKKKGMRMGGPVPLGYDVENKKLVINQNEAETVRFIFSRYSELKSLSSLLRELRIGGILTKRTQYRDGSCRGGVPFSKGPLAYLLRNRVYVGDVVHKGRYYRGEHPPIIGQATFEAVQQCLSEQAPASTTKVNAGSLLVGRLYDDQGFRMTPTTTNKSGVRYRYYTSTALQQGRGEEAGAVSRVSAPEIEAAVVKALRAQARGTTQCSHTDGAEAVLNHTSHGAMIEGMVDRITVRDKTLEIVCRSEDAVSEVLSIAFSRKPHRMRREILHRAADRSEHRPIHSETRARIVEAIAKARSWLDDLLTGRASSTQQLAEREGCSERSVRMTLNLAFLSPELVRAAVEGTLPHGVTLTALTAASVNWSEQREALETSLAQR